MTVRIYVARPVDDLDRSASDALVQRVRNDFPNPRFEVLDPMTIGDIKDRGDSSYANVVDKQLTLLRSCDVILVNMSISNHTYIGCVAEMVYARIWKLSTVVYVGSNRIGYRPWLRYHADHIDEDWEGAVRWIHARLH
jgi:hypothetical protein